MKVLSFSGFRALLHRPRSLVTKHQVAMDSPSALGQAYTEYLVILLFGVLLALGVVIVDREVLPEHLRIIERFYGYVFDYYAGLANYLNLPFF